jgi:hypothetical protein
MSDDHQIYDLPALSVIVAVPDNFETVRLLIRYLARQTIREQLEIVFVVPSKTEFKIERAELKHFFQHKVIETGPFKSLNHARVAGIRESSAAVVVLTEDHCFPSDEWAQALVESHKNHWAGVGPVVGLANIHSNIAWANYFIQYSPWIKPSTSAIVADIPGHNSSYKKQILMAYGEMLEPMMDFEYVLHQDLQKKGHQLYMDCRAETYHLFMTDIKPSLQEHFCIGQLLAASRTRHFTFFKRLQLILASPLVPVVRFIRIIRDIYRYGWQKELLPGIIPWLFIGLTVSAVGEWTGFVFGKGRAQSKTIDLDFNRHRFVSSQEKQRIWSEKLVDFKNEPTKPAL